MTQMLTSALGYRYFCRVRDARYIILKMCLVDLFTGFSTLSPLVDGRLVTAARAGRIVGIGPTSENLHGCRENGAGCTHDTTTHAECGAAH
jgi:hypothetical protein